MSDETRADWDLFLGGSMTPEVPTLDLDELRRLAEKLSRRQKLEPAEQTLWDEQIGPAQERVLDEFMAAIGATYEETLKNLKAVAPTSAYEELKRVVPVLDDILNKDEFRSSLLVNDGLRSVCYDESRLARRWLVFAQKMVRVWEGIWEGLSISTSQEQRKSQFLRATKKLWHQIARIESFLQLYDDTQKQVREVYERMKTLLSSESSWPRM